MVLDRDQMHEVATCLTNLVHMIHVSQDVQNTIVSHLTRKICHVTWGLDSSFVEIAFVVVWIIFVAQC